MESWFHGLRCMTTDFEYVYADMLRQGQRRLYVPTLIISLSLRGPAVRNGCSKC